MITRHASCYLHFCYFSFPSMQRPVTPSTVKPVPEELKSRPKITRTPPPGGWPETTIKSPRLTEEEQVMLRANSRVQLQDAGAGSAAAQPAGISSQDEGVEGAPPIVEKLLDAKQYDDVRASVCRRAPCIHLKFSQMPCRCLSLAPNSQERRFNR